MKIKANNSRAYVAHCDALETLAADPGTAHGPDRYARLHRVEARHARAAVALCNGEISQAEYDARAERNVAAVARILGCAPAGLSLNGDPRGYALKLDPERGAKIPAGLQRDWGGNGILAPEF
jgi:hypothetical protein